MTEPENQVPAAPELPVLERPADGVPPLTDTAAGLATLVERIAAGHGPVAVDSERAQGYRYSGSAWLIQLRREGAGTFLLDPMAFGHPADLRALNDAMAGAEWVLHAASQDLPCLREVGLFPHALFDTELAARLLNMERVGLGPLVEEVFGLRLRKEHSAADWSTRPLPEDWLIYAALDVELLIPLRDKLYAHLAAAGRVEWAEQEFAAILTGFDADPVARVDPWRRTSGLHSLKTPAQLAVVRALWQERDAIARRLDKGPGRILPDAAITEAAALVDTRQSRWPEREDLRHIDGFKRRNARRFEANWLAAIEQARGLTRAQYPPRHLPLDGPPQHARGWEARHPEEYRRWLALRPVVNDIAEKLGVPAENLLSPGVLRWLAWEPPATTDVVGVAAALTGHGARPWQAEIVAGPLSEALETAAMRDAPTDG